MLAADLPFAMNNVQREKLIESALAARQNAYAPYSQFAVGAALLALDGRIFTGCNVENASYGLTICAERAAVTAAITAGQRQFVALALAADAAELPMPCGACLQVLAEFCPADFPILTLRSADPIRPLNLTLNQLLPNVFRLRPPEQ